MDTFFRKNDIGVDIEYTEIGYYTKDGKTYKLYTDFTTDLSNIAGIKIYVDVMTNGNYEEVSSELTKIIIKEYEKEILKFKGNYNG